MGSVTSATVTWWAHLVASGEEHDLETAVAPAAPPLINREAGWWSWPRPGPLVWSGDVRPSVRSVIGGFPGVTGENETSADHGRTHIRKHLSGAAEPCGPESPALSRRRCGRASLRNAVIPGFLAVVRRLRALWTWLPTSSVALDKQ